MARQYGATGEELQETMQIAMTVGATKIQILHESTLAAMEHPNTKKETDKPQAGNTGCEP